MIGQAKLKRELERYGLNDLPHTIMFRGDDGCGKHVIVKELTDRLGIELVDITNDLNFETISSIYEKASLCAYVIDLSESNDRQQNAILKLLEEPVSNSYIFVLVERNGHVLDTITNRCVIFDFEPYSDEELLATQPKGRDYSKSIAFCRTPGRLLQTNESTIDDCELLCEAIVTRIGMSRLPNALTIAKRVNCKDEYDKIDFRMFIDVLSKKAFDHFVLGVRDSRMYDIISEERRKLLTYKPNKETFLEHLILRLWESERK